MRIAQINAASIVDYIELDAPASNLALIFDCDHMPIEDKAGTAEIGAYWTGANFIPRAVQAEFASRIARVLQYRASLNSWLICNAVKYAGVTDLAQWDPDDLAASTIGPKLNDWEGAMIALRNVGGPVAPATWPDPPDGWKATMALCG